MMAMLRAELEDVKPVLIIADAAIRMHKLDENAAADVSSLFRDALAPLQTAYGVSIVLLHHFRKRQQDDQAGDWEEWVRGSGDWGGAVDGILGVFKQDTGRRILRHGKPRWSEPMPSCYVAFGITADAASFTYEGDFSETRVIAADAEIEVWAYLNEAGCPPSGGRLTKEVEKHFEDQMSGRTVWGILKSLEGKGRARSEQEKNEGRGWRKRWFALVPGEARNA